MTSQRDETTHALAGEEMTDDPIIIERRDEALGGRNLEGDHPAADVPAPDVPAADVPAGDVPAGDGMAEDGTASDEPIGRPAAPDTGGADPAPLVVPPEVPRADTGGPYRPGPAADAGPPVSGSAVPGPAVADSAFADSAAADSAVADPAAAGPGVTGPAVPGPAAADAGVPAAGPAGGGVPAAALSEQQWPAIQAMFVDDPKGSVQRAAAAAEEVAKAFVASLQREQAALRASWENGGDASTEDLRTALQQYRAFCGRLEGLA